MNKGISGSSIFLSLLILFFLVFNLGNDLLAKTQGNESGGEQTGHLFKVVSIVDQRTIWLWAPTSKIIKITANFSTDPGPRYVNLQFSDIYAIVLKNGKALIIYQLFSNNSSAQFYIFNKDANKYEQYSLEDNPYLRDIEIFLIGDSFYFNREDIKDIILW
ncbi:MAG: hypothetical protein HQK51_03265 [Oligoflexia bacterium]|nr:hypothetical protein [Oligoflexia bacterium]